MISKTVADMFDGDDTLGERPIGEAQHLYKIFLRGGMSIEEILQTIRVSPKDEQIARENTGPSGVAQLEMRLRWRQRVEQIFLHMVRSGATIPNRSRRLGRPPSRSGKSRIRREPR